MDILSRLGSRFATVYDVPKLPQKLRDALPIAFAVLIIAVVFTLTWKWERGDFDSPNKEDNSSSQETPDRVEEQPPVPSSKTKRNDLLGAEEFARYYHDVANYARRTGDLQPLKDLYDDSCEVCKADIEQLERATSGGYYLKGGQYEVLAVEAGVFEGQIYVTVNYNRSGSQVFKKDGSPAGEKTEGSENAQGIMDIAFDDDHWEVLGLHSAQGDA